MSCNKCNSCDPCDSCCSPAHYDGCTNFDIQADPYDPTKWIITACGCAHKISIPKIAETCTTLSIDYSGASLNYVGECGTETITGEQLGSIIELDWLRNVDIDEGLDGNCYELVYRKYNNCGDGCQSAADRWQNFNPFSADAQQDEIAYLRGANEYGCPVYLKQPENCSYLQYGSCGGSEGWHATKIPDAGDCVMEADDEGYYHILKKDDCGCIVECKMPIMPAGMTALNYQRDSVPDDPDFPWYYGNYNDTINLHLADNAPKYFGKYALKVTVNYGVQAIKSDNVDNYNWRSIVVPVVNGEDIRTTQAGSILQATCIATSSSSTNVPWGSQSLRGSLVFIVPKGKEAYLHHEYRVRTNASFPNYYTGSWDGQRVPDKEAALNSVLHPASRLNGLQVIIEPTQGDTDYSPVTDTYRDQLDSPVDTYEQDYT